MKYSTKNSMIFEFLIPAIYMLALFAVIAGELLIAFNSVSCGNTGFLTLFAAVVVLGFTMIAGIYGVAVLMLKTQNVRAKIAFASVKNAFLQSWLQ